MQTTAELSKVEDQAVRSIIQSSEKLDSILVELQDNKTISRQVAISTERLFPDSLPVHVNGYTELPSEHNYNVSVESLRSRAADIIRLVWATINSAIRKVLNALISGFNSFISLFKRTEKHVKAVDIIEEAMKSALSEMDSKSRDRALSVIENERLELVTALGNGTKAGKLTTSELCDQMLHKGPIVDICMQTNHAMPEFLTEVSTKLTKLAKSVDYSKVNKDGGVSIRAQLSGHSDRTMRMESLRSTLVKSGVELSRDKTFSYGYMLKDIHTHMLRLSFSQVNVDRRIYDNLMIQPIHELRSTVNVRQIESMLRAVSKYQTVFDSLDITNLEAKHTIRNFMNRLWNDYSGFLSYSEIFDRYSNVRNSVYKYRHAALRRLFERMEKELKDETLARVIVDKYKKVIYDKLTALKD